MVGNRIQEVLDIKGISQKELAEQIGVTEVTISRYINGKRTPHSEILKKMAEYLEVSVDFLIENNAKEMAKLPRDIEVFAYKLSTLSPKKRKQLLDMGEQLFNMIDKEDK